MIPITIVRRSRPPRHGVVVHVDPVPDGLRVARITPDGGPPPDMAHLLGQTFIDRQDLRRAVLAALRAAVGDPRSSVGDTLDRVLLTDEAVVAWEAFARLLGRDLARAGVSSRQIHDERAEAQADGSLLLYVEAGGERHGLTVPAGHWAWREPT